MIEGGCGDPCGPFRFPVGAVRFRFRSPVAVGLVLSVVGRQSDPRRLGPVTGSPPGTAPRVVQPDEDGPPVAVVHASNPVPSLVGACERVGGRLISFIL